MKLEEVVPTIAINFSLVKMGERAYALAFGASSDPHSFYAAIYIPGEMVERFKVMIAQIETSSARLYTVPTDADKA